MSEQPDKFDEVATGSVCFLMPPQKCSSVTARTLTAPHLIMKVTTSEKLKLKSCASRFMTSSFATDNNIHSEMDFGLQ